MDIDRPQLYIFYLPVTIISLVIYVQILIELYHKRGFFVYNSFFFRMTCSQSIYDISYVVMYFVMELPGDWKAMKPFYESLNGTIIPQLIFAHLFLCFIAQILGVTMMAFSRMLLVCHPTRKITRLLKNLTTGQVIVAHFILPALYACYILFGQSWRYYGPYGDSGRMVRRGSAQGIAINSVTLCVVGFAGSVVSAVCYIRIYLALRKRPFRMWRSDLHILATSFVLFCALCTLTAYFIVSLYTLFVDMSLYFPIRKHFYAFTFFLSLANPWCLIISSASMRSIVLRRTLPSCCARLRVFPQKLNSDTHCTASAAQAICTIY